MIGVSSLKGFAVTLGIEILSSTFSAAPFARSAPGFRLRRARAAALPL